ncbi:hypothetical protein LA080_009875 [Diaporthe eres]|nr:hypothetical protein LA080_009875 [Diaporthe eres]
MPSNIPTFAFEPNLDPRRRPRHLHREQGDAIPGNTLSTRPGKTTRNARSIEHDISLPPAPEQPSTITKPISPDADSAWKRARTSRDSSCVGLPSNLNTRAVDSVRLRGGQVPPPWLGPACLTSEALTPQSSSALQSDRYPSDMESFLSSFPGVELSNFPNHFALIAIHPCRLQVHGAV